MGGVDESVLVSSALGWEADRRAITTPPAHFVSAHSQPGKAAVAILESFC